MNVQRMLWKLSEDVFLPRDRKFAATVPHSEKKILFLPTEQSTKLSAPFEVSPLFASSDQGCFAKKSKIRANFASLSLQVFLNLKFAQNEQNIETGKVVTFYADFLSC